MPFDETRGAHYVTMVEHSIPIDPRVVAAAVRSAPATSLTAALPRKPTVAAVPRASRPPTIRTAKTSPSGDICTTTPYWVAIGTLFDQYVTAEVGPTATAAERRRVFETLKTKFPDHWRSYSDREV